MFAPAMGSMGTGLSQGLMNGLRGLPPGAGGAVAGLAIGIAVGTAGYQIWTNWRRPAATYVPAGWSADNGWCDPNPNRTYACGPTLKLFSGALCSASAIDCATINALAAPETANVGQKVQFLWGKNPTFGHQGQRFTRTGAFTDVPARLPEKTRVAVLPGILPVPAIDPAYKPIAQVVPDAIPVPYRDRLGVMPGTVSGYHWPAVPIPRTVPVAPVWPIHPLVPPGKRTVEKKYRGFQRFVYKAINVVTESHDAIACVWKSIPAKDRKRILGRRLPGDRTNSTMYPRHPMYKYGIPVHQTPQQMMRDIRANQDKLDARKIFDCLLENEIIDQAIGRSVRATKNNLRDAGMKRVTSFWGPAL